MKNIFFIIVSLLVAPSAFAQDAHPFVVEKTVPFGFFEGENTVSVALGDVNGDGHLDVVAGNTDGQDYIYLNDGTDAFPLDGAHAVPIGDARSSTVTVALHDMDGDGRLDVIQGNFRHPDTVYLVRADDAGRMFFEPVLIGDRPYDGLIAIGDLTNDGRPDVVVGSYGYRDVLYVNERDGSSIAFTGYPIEENLTLTTGLRLGYLNDPPAGRRARMLDIIRGFGDGRVEILYGNGTADPAGRGRTLVQTDHIRQPNGIDAADVNGDGYEDIVLNYLYHPGNVFLSRRNRVYRRTLPGQDGWSRRHAKVFADVDGDGAADIIEGGEDGTKVYFNESKTSGRFGPPIPIGLPSPVPHATTSLAAARDEATGLLWVAEGNFAYIRYRGHNRQDQSVIYLIRPLFSVEEPAQDERGRG